MKGPSTESTITIWIVEDDIKYRESIAFLFEHTSDMRCAQTFGSCEEGLAYLKTHLAETSASSVPDVVLLDINLPGMNGLEGLKHFRALLPNICVVMLTIRDDAQTIYDAFRAGASGYLLKNASIDQVLAAIREANQGGTLMPAPVARMVLAFLQEQETTASYGLTEREIDVLREMIAGYKQREIAERLFVSRNTVNTHIQHIYEKLHVHSGIEAVVKAITERLV